MIDKQTSDIQNKKLITFSLAIVPLAMVLGNSMLIPELPNLAEVLGVSNFEIGLLITFFSLSGGLSIPILGYLSDKYNRKRILIYSLLIYGTGGIIAGLLALLNNPQIYSYILFARIIQGFGAGGTYPLAIALAGDIFNPQNRKQILGILEAANAFGKVVSPFLGALIALFFWPGLFFIYAILTLPLAIIIYYFIPEPQPSTIKINFKDYLIQITTIITDKGSSFILYLATSIVVLFILFGVLSFVSETLSTVYNIYGLTKAGLIAIPIIAMVITAYLMGLYLKRNNPQLNYLLSSGLLLDAISLLTLPFLDGLILYLVLIACVGIANGIVLTVLNTIITSSSSESYRGGLTSIYSSMRFLGIALGPPVFTLLNQISTFTMFAIPALIAMILSLFAFFI
ncbi:MFS transporter [Halanaerobacter jeridensis]|uniref:ACDE family multidrug resistance protein n=1 Tax=Halanaerobacter jeridensis TaxID=706427 RepID=A0A938XUI0_9FIRM|nr:MFS transporter [Halanaerobacter jeridensis]MBM7555812.1 ACDE family multidrug resistance protein [Halanaerobacter jeridensis]